MSEPTSSSTSFSSFLPMENDYIPLEILSQATLNGIAPEPQFVIKPSSVLDSPVVRRPLEAEVPGMIQESRHELVRSSLKNRQLIRLGEVAVAKRAAESHYNAQVQAEVQALTSAGEAGENWTSLSAPHAYALASAVKATAQAKFEFEQARMRECLETLDVLRSEVDFATSRMQQANRQFYSLLGFFDTHHIPIERFAHTVSSPTSFPSEYMEDRPPLS